MDGDIAPLPKGNILVVDDNPANLRLLSSMLVEQGYKVRSVISGAMALTAVHAAPPDLMLLDINMPEMNGYQVCARLQAEEGTRSIPIIFISALDEIEDKVQAFTIGGVDYVTKPFQFEEVLARVQAHLTLRNLQKQLQAANFELGQRLAELQARNEELDAFAHTVAHDLKNPLTALLGYSTMLEVRHSDLSDEQLEHSLGAISKNARRMNNIIEELLLLAGVRRQEDLPLETLDMGEIVAGALARLADIIRAQQVEVVTPDTWPPVLGRSQWVEEVWVNYLSNAIKYGGQPPHICLGVADHSSGAPSTAGQPGFVEFWVCDNGPGLTAEEQARLFTPFERLHQARAEGHGLGLSIVRRIVEKMNGQVGVRSDGLAGQGSIFFFTLPAGHTLDNETA